MTTGPERVPMSAQPCLLYMYDLLLAGQREGASAVIMGSNSLLLMAPSAVPFQPTIPMFSMLYSTLDMFVDAIDAGGAVEIELPHLVDGSGPGACAATARLLAPVRRRSCVQMSGRACLTPRLVCWCCDGAAYFPEEHDLDALESTTIDFHVNDEPTTAPAGQVGAHQDTCLHVRVSL